MPLLITLSAFSRTDFKVAIHHTVCLLRACQSLLLLLAGTSLCQDLPVPQGPRSLSRLRRGSEQDFWSLPSVNYNSGGLEPGYPIMDIPVNDVPLGPDRDLDKIQVVSSAIRVLPRNRVRTKRQVDVKKSQRNPPEDDPLRWKRELTWRKPRQHQFVTNKIDRLPPPPIVRVYPPVDRSERFYDRDYRKGQRRIIYYANLPEIVRPPVQWYNTRGEFYDTPRQTYPSPSPSYSSPTFSSSPSYTSSSYPSPSDNEITRVQSNIIDVTNSRYTGFSSTPKFTIIDVEPPYNYPSYNRRPPVRYNYPSVPYTPSTYFSDVRTPPYRDYSQNFRPDSSLEPVKLQIPTTDRPSTANTTDQPVNTTRYIPDTIPVSLRSLSKFVT